MLSKKFIGEGQNSPITLVHGVFGSGKSYLLSVAIIFLFRLKSLQDLNPHSRPLKILVSSLTNVAGKTKKQTKNNF